MQQLSGPSKANPLSATARRRRSHFQSLQVAYDNYASKPPMAAFEPDAVRVYRTLVVREGHARSLTPVSATDVNEVTWDLYNEYLKNYSQIGEDKMKVSAGDFIAFPLNGKAHTIVNTGTVEASTVNGSIKASTGSGSWSGTLDFQTVNGSVTLTLPAGAGAAISAETVNGDFSSDFPLTVEAGRYVQGGGCATVGSSGSEASGSAGSDSTGRSSPARRSDSRIRRSSSARLAPGAQNATASS